MGTFVHTKAGIKVNDVMKRFYYYVNLNTLYVLTLPGQSTIAVNVMIALAALQFSYIVIYHILNYVLTGSPKNRIKLCMDTKKFMLLHKSKVITDLLPKRLYQSMLSL